MVVWHIDRLIRKTVDLTVTGDLDLSTDTGRLLARILAAIARGEVDRKSARQKRANLQRAEAGATFWTRRPIGYARDDDGKVVVVRPEADALRLAAEMVVDGATLAATVRKLDEVGSVTSVGVPWNVTTLRRCLLNPRYSGRVIYRKADMGTGQWPVILDADLQRQLAEVLRDPTRRLQQGTELKYLLSGLVVCGKCGDRAFASPLGPKGRRWMVYRCRTGHLARRMDLVDEAVVGAVLERLQRPDAADLLIPDVDLDNLRDRANGLRERRDALAGMLADGLLSPTAAREQAGRLTDQLQQVEREVSAALTRSPVASLVGADDVAAEFAAMPLRIRRDVIDELATVTLLPAGKGVRFSPQHLVLTWNHGSEVGQEAVSGPGDS